MPKNDHDIYNKIVATFFVCHLSLRLLLLCHNFCSHGLFRMIPQLHCSISLSPSFCFTFFSFYSCILYRNGRHLLTITSFGNTWCFHYIACACVYIFLAIWATTTSFGYPQAFKIFYRVSLMVKLVPLEPDDSSLLSIFVLLFKPTSVTLHRINADTPLEKQSK